MIESPKHLFYLRVIAGSAAFVAITWGLILAFVASMILWEMLRSVPESDSIQMQHVNQHISEHEQYARMIELLEELNEQGEPSVPPSKATQR